MPLANNGRHTFSFEGGDLLTTIGATYLVSYLYFKHVDSSHQNWISIKTQRSRISVISRTEEYHQAWLEKIGSMNEANLNKNTLGLNSSTIKKMALSVIELLPPL